MSVLGALMEGQDVYSSPVTKAREALEAARRAGVPWDLAWEQADRHVRNTVGWGTWTKHTADEVSPVEFARVRLERAYQGQDPSVRQCQHPDVHSCPYPAEAGSLCLLHAPIPGEVRTA